MFQRGGSLRGKNGFAICERVEKRLWNKNKVPKAWQISSSIMHDIMKWSEEKLIYHVRDNALLDGVVFRLSDYSASLITTDITKSTVPSAYAK